MTDSVAQTRVRSNFVSALSWVLIVFNAFGTLITLGQNIMLNVFFPFDEMERSLASELPEDVPMFVSFMFDHIRALLGGIFVASVGMLVISIALLKRKEWARIAVIAVLGLGLAYNACAGVFIVAFFDPLSVVPQDSPADALLSAHRITVFMKVFTVTLLLAGSVLLVWLIKRLADPTVRAEFVR